MMAAHDFRLARIGDVFPPHDGRRLWAWGRDPAWFIFQVPPRGELPASAWLARNGVAETWYPSETAFKRNRFRPNERIPYERAVAPGYLFAVLARQPHWDILFARSQGKLLRVVSHNGEPFPMPESEFGKMKQMPRRLAEIREAEIAKRTIHPGDKAVVSVAGIEWTVDVSRIHAGIASFIIPLLGGREVTAPVTALRKAEGLA